MFSWSVRNNYKLIPDICCYYFEFSVTNKTYISHCILNIFHGCLLLDFENLNYNISVMIRGRGKTCLQLRMWSCARAMDIYIYICWGKNDILDINNRTWCPHINTHYLHVYNVVEDNRKVKENWKKELMMMMIFKKMRRSLYMSS